MGSGESRSDEYTATGPIDTIDTGTEPGTYPRALLLPPYRRRADSARSIPGGLYPAGCCCSGTGILGLKWRGTSTGLSEKSWCS